MGFEQGFEEKAWPYTTLLHRRYIPSHSPASVSEEGPEDKGQDPNIPRFWKPPTLRVSFLLAIIISACGLIGVLQILLLRSQTNNGLLFSSEIGNLPTGQIFSYLYLPTIIAVLFSFLWNWIDLDAKRLEPYYRLAGKAGALGRDSMLLHYPFDFVASVPLKAARRRHWTVFSASMAMVVIFWGLTPIQSGMLAVRTIALSREVQTAVSTKFMPLAEQNSQLTGSYAQSVYNIAWLNETLPPFMARDFLLAPFGVLNNLSGVKSNETWTATTRLYSVDVNCQHAVETDDGFNSNSGCKGPKYMPPPGIKSDQYSALYVGFWYEETMDYYLSQYCPQSANHTFLVQWSRGQKTAKNESIPTEPIEATTIYCQSTYYQQMVNATVSPPHMAVVETTALGPKEQIPSEIFNSTDFEWGMSAGFQKYQNRGQYPTTGWPDADGRIAYMGLDTSLYLAPMTTFAIAAYQQPVEAYMNATLLQESYQAAYRLLFARHLSDILSSELDNSTASTGVRQFETSAVLLVPIFVYIVEALLAGVAIAALAIILTTLRRQNNLVSDPSNLASLMALSAEDSHLVSSFSSCDRMSEKCLGDRYRDIRFSLSDCDDGGHKFVLEETENEANASEQARAHASSVSGNSRPKELSTLFGTLFLIVQVAILAGICFMYLHAKANNGLPLPSTSTLVRQIVENYVPMAASTFIEPLWVVLDRLLCMLQPYEQLRKGHTSASQTINADYSSLPPQLVIWRALRARHILLAMVCLMALLANVLAVAFSGLLNEGSASMQYAYSFLILDNPQFNISALPTSGYDQFYVSMSNLTAGTPSPAWTDETSFYLPFRASDQQNDSLQYAADTTTLGAVLDCVPLTQEGQDTYQYSFPDISTIHVTANISFPDQPSCHTNTTASIRGGPQGNVALEALLFGYNLLPFLHSTTNTSACANVILAGWLRSENATADFETTDSETDIEGGHLGPLAATWIACKPRLWSGQSTVVVDSQNRVRASTTINRTDAELNTLLQNNATSLIAAVNGLLGQTDFTLGPTWHNDSYPSDFLSYLMGLQTNSATSFFDPALPPPRAGDAIEALSSLYQSLFATVLGSNVDKLLLPGRHAAVNGTVIKQETRIFVSEPMFVVAVVILSLYIGVTLLVYVRRPWNVLPRMPTTIASQIAFFAPSHALEDLRGTAGLRGKERRDVVEGLGRRYVFGKFIGTDGKAHVGVEREPFAVVLRKGDTEVGEKGEKEVRRWRWERWRVGR